VVCAHAKPRGPAGKRLRVPSRWVVALQAGLDLPLPAAAAVGGDVTTAYTLYARTGLGPREPVVVLGATAVTRFLVEILRGKGITPTVIADEGDWSSWLLGKGAAVVSGSGDALVASVGAAVSAQGMGNRPWRVIATEPSVVPLAAQLAGPRATLTVLADREIPALPGELMAHEVTVIGVAGPHPDLIVEAAALCVKGEIDLVAGVGDGPTLARVIAT
jgi:D-arabinose 1-dehydrogenase-like Zn-dependent alcohol dehydrogenase